MSAGNIFIMPHERHEAIEAYSDRLTQAQIDQIEDAPDEALISLKFNIGAPGWEVTIVEEG